jgi:DHA2 family multidrug resistance protein
MSPRPPLKGWALVLVTFALAMGNFMEVLDTTIANVSVPSIAGNLGVSPNQGTWIITSYAVANAVSVLLTGFLAGRFGQVRIFLGSMVLFTLASLACGFATSFEMLLVSRMAQGGVSGLMVPLSQALLLASYPPARRNVGLAIWAMTVTVAPIIGPILGGWITDNIGWRWIFFINVPVGVAAIFVAWEILHDRESDTRRVPIDWTGLVLIVVWVGALQIMLDKGNELDWFGSGFICLLAATCGGGFVIFLAWELTANHPIVDLRLFRIRSFAAGTGALSLAFAVFFASVVLLPLWLQTQVGYTATWAGLVMAPTGILAVIGAPLVGKNVHRVDARIFTTIAFLIFALASFWRAGFTADADFATYVYPQWIMGIAVALFFTPLISIALGELPPDRVALGSGVLNFCRMSAASFAASLVITLWDHRTARHAVTLVERLGPYDPAYRNAIDAMTGAGFTPAAANVQLAREMANQASVRAIDDIFWASGFAFLSVIVFIWVVHRPKARTAAAPKNHDSSR